MKELNKPKMPSFIPIDKKIHSYREQILLKYYKEFLMPNNYEILNEINIQYSLSDIEYSYKNIILKRRKYETINNYKKRVLSSIYFSCFADYILSIISIITKMLYINRKILVTLIGGIATRVYNMEHSTNDIDIKLYPLNDMVYDVLYNEESIINYIREIIKINMKEEKIRERLLKYIELLNKIDYIKEDEIYKELEKKIRNNIINLNILFNKIDKGLYKLTFEMNEIKVKILDISLYDKNDKKFQLLQNKINKTERRVYYNIPVIVKKGLYGYFFIESYRHILEEKRILLEEIENDKEEYTREEKEYLKYKFERSYKKLITEPKKRVYIGGSK
jgi:hypothetical protein